MSVADDGKGAPFALTWKTGLVVAAVIIAVQALALHIEGHPAICTCGYVKLWHGVVVSSENSQHISDWYTPSHIIHGFLFYALSRWLFPKRSIWFRLAFVLLIEGGWEIRRTAPSSSTATAKAPSRSPDRAGQAPARLARGGVQIWRRWRATAARAADRKERRHRPFRRRRSHFHIGLLCASAYPVADSGTSSFQGPHTRNAHVPCQHN